eukprot:m.162107 g.162107  ORF g.162107 m.162107 type:complete len:936 (-) comp31262_c0_seq1:73-2880(-)
MISTLGLVFGLLLINKASAGFCGFNVTSVPYSSCHECDIDPAKLNPPCTSNSNGTLEKGAKNTDASTAGQLCFLKCTMACRRTIGNPQKCCKGYHGAQCNVDVDACVVHPCGTNEKCIDESAPPSVMGQYETGDLSAADRRCVCESGYSRASPSSTCALNVSLITELRQSDFTEGTYLIKTPGLYKLMENVSFNPNSRQCRQSGNNMPREDQFTTNGGVYDRRAFGIGFFAAIAITASDVTLDLNGYSLEQSVEHALQQRFFALIELNNAPFHYDQGPHNFTVDNRLITVTDVTITNGRLGRSSHHGIHGHSPNATIISNLIIEDFEVAGVSLNGAENLAITRVVIGPSRHDVPVKGIFSTGRFILPYVQQIVSSCPTLSIEILGKTMSGKTILDKLTQTLDDTFDAVVHGKGTVPDLVNNMNISSEGLPDGSAIYGIVLGTYGTHTNGFVMEREEQTCLDGDGEVVGMLDNYSTYNGLHRCKASKDSVASGNVNLKITDVKIIGIDVAVNEVEAVKSATFDKNLRATHLRAAVDVVGAVYQYEVNVNDDGFIGNAISNAQLFVSKNRVECMTDPDAKYADFGTVGCQRSQQIQPVGGPATCQRKLGGNASKLSIYLDTIPKSILDWAANGGRYQPGTSDFVTCGGDNMFHVNKGAIGLRIDGADGVVLRNVEIDTVRNLGKPVSSRCGAETSFLHPEQTQYWYTGTDSNGISLSSALNVDLQGTNFIRNIVSASGNAYGIQITHVSDFINGKVIMGLLSAQLASAFRADQDKSAAEFYAARPRVRPSNSITGRTPVGEVIFMDNYACIPGDGMDFNISMNMAMSTTFDPFTMTCDIITDLETQKSKQPWVYTPVSAPITSCGSEAALASGSIPVTSFVAIVVVLSIVLLAVIVLVAFKVSKLKAVSFDRPGSLEFNNPVSINTEEEEIHDESSA